MFNIVWNKKLKEINSSEPKESEIKTAMECIKYMALNWTNEYDIAIRVTLRLEVATYIRQKINNSGTAVAITKNGFYFDQKEYCYKQTLYIYKSEEHLKAANFTRPPKEE